MKRLYVFIIACWVACYVAAARLAPEEALIVGTAMALSWHTGFLIANDINS